MEETKHVYKDLMTNSKTHTMPHALRRTAGLFVPAVLATVLGGIVTAAAQTVTTLPGAPAVRQTPQSGLLKTVPAGGIQNPAPKAIQFAAPKPIASTTTLQPTSTTTKVASTTTAVATTTTTKSVTTTTAQIVAFPGMKSVTTPVLTMTGLGGTAAAAAANQGKTEPFAPKTTTTAALTMTGLGGTASSASNAQPFTPKSVTTAGLTMTGLGK